MPFESTEAVRPLRKPEYTYAFFSWNDDERARQALRGQRETLVVPIIASSVDMDSEAESLILNYLEDGAGSESDSLDNDGEE